MTDNPESTIRSLRLFSAIFLVALSVNGWAKSVSSAYIGIQSTSKHSFHHIRLASFEWQIADRQKSEP